MKPFLVLSCMFTGLLMGCGPTVKPAIKVATAPNLIEVNGAGFSNTTPSCATLSLFGMPSGPPVVNIGQPPCTKGAFQQFGWKYAYVAGCTPGASQSLEVLAVDNPTFTPAGAGISIPWGKNCAFLGTCGQIGQYPCPSGCLQGSATNSTLCSCGDEGQPLCTTGNQCLPGLNPQQQGPSIICTATCGHTKGYTPCTSAMGPCSGHPPTLEEQQSPCVTQQQTSDGGTRKIYTCYEHSVIDTSGNCACMPNLVNQCQEDTSDTTNIVNPSSQGLCVHAQYLMCN